VKVDAPTVTHGPKVDVDLSELDTLLEKANSSSKRAYEPKLSPKETDKILDSIKATKVEARPEKSTPPASTEIAVSELDSLIDTMSPKKKEVSVDKDLDDLRDIANSRRSRREQEKKPSRN